MNKGLLFDLDGVLVDTAKFHFLAWKSVAKELGIEFSLEDNERLKGVSRIKSFQIMLEIGQREMSDEEQEIYCTKKNLVYLDYIKQLTPADCLPGVHDFLHLTREKGYKIGLGSASKNAKLILNSIGLSGLFDVIIDGTCVGLAKPHPEVFIKGAQGLGVNQVNCIVFEDAIAGIEAAHSAGMKVVGIGSKLLLPNADINVDNFLIHDTEIWNFINDKYVL